jgi:hypothetical protein
MADRRDRVAKANRLVRLQGLKLEVDQARLAILKRERDMLAGTALLLLRQMSDHADSDLGGSAIAADMLGHAGHRDAIVGNLTELQAGIVNQARIALRLAQHRSELMRRESDTRHAEDATEEAVARMVESASLPKG